MAYDYMDAISVGIKNYILEYVELGSMTIEKLFQYLDKNKGVLVGYVYTDGDRAKDCLTGNTDLLGEALDFF